MNVMTSRVFHTREAELYLRLAADQRINNCFTDPQTAELLLRLSQAHATLAALPNEAVAIQETATELCAERDAFRKVIVGHVYEALMSPSREARKFATSIATELDQASMNIDGAIEDRSESSGQGPYHYTVDGVVYRLLVQLIDDEGIAWEHTGDWTGLGEPVMGPANGWADRPTVHLPELIRTRGPLRPRRPDPSIAPF